MKIALAADWHLGHEKLTTLGYRPPDFSERILSNLAAIQHQANVMMCLGDVCIGNDGHWHAEAWKAIGGLTNLKRWLILGNHDRKSKTWYLQHGWDFVADELYLDIHGLRLLFTHIPQPPGNYDLNIHGHMHDTGHHPECGLHDKQRLIASEPDYMPVMLTSILKGVTRP